VAEVCRAELVGTWRDVHLDASEGPTRELRSDLHPPGEAAAVVLHQLLDRSGDERELVTIHVRRESLDESLSQFVSTRYIVTETEVDVFGEPSIVPQSDLERLTIRSKSTRRRSRSRLTLVSFERESSRCSSAMRSAWAVW
jgi:hypothetical protein